DLAYTGSLGHILHLLEDMSVPAHTRNDPHPGSDSYELYADRFNLAAPDGNLVAKEIKLKPVISNDLNSYFTSLATYTNNNFYSDNTIGLNSGYNKPEIDLINIESKDSRFYVRNSVDNQQYYLVVKKSISANVLDTPSDIEIDDDVVKESYWNVLSAKSVQYSAGVIDLFFKEVAKAQSDPVYARSFDAEPKSMIGQAVSSLLNFAEAVRDTSIFAFNQIIGSGGGKLVQTVDLSAIRGTDANFSPPVTTSSAEQTTSQSNTKYNLRITEIMYDPKGGDEGNEWIEILNNGDESVDLSSLVLRTSGSNHLIKKNSNDLVLRPGIYGVIADDPQSFRDAFPNYSGIRADSVVSLNNADGDVSIFNGNVLLDKITYSSESGANGDGSSLQLTGGKWIAALPTPGEANKIAPEPSKPESSPGEKKQKIIPLTTSTAPAEFSLTKARNASSTQTAPVESSLCPFSIQNQLANPGVIFNEIAWMGGVNSANDEWIELKNITLAPIDISGWQILSRDEHIKAVVPSGVAIAPGEFYLLERTDVDSISGVKADLAYTGSLVNSGADLKLFNNKCLLVDSVYGTSGWPAGDAGSRRTMERNSAGIGWHTSMAIGGTPQKGNDQAFVAPAGGGGGGTTSAAAQISGGNNSRGDNATSTATSSEVVYKKLLITEIQLASASSTKDEFVEIYNPNDSSLDLTDWSVMKKTKNADMFSTFAKADLWSGKTIQPGSFLIIANSEGSIRGDILTAYGVADDNSLVIKNPNHEIVDKVGWGEAGDCEGNCAPQPESGQSIQRKKMNGEFVDSGDNFSDFDIQICPAPGASSSVCASDSADHAPAATSTVALPTIANFLANYDSNVLKVFLSWDDFAVFSSSGDKLSTSTATGTAVFYTVQLSTSTSAGETDWGEDRETGAISFLMSSTSTTLSINEVGRNYGFRVSAFDEDGTVLAEATASVSAPSFLSNLYFYRDPRNGVDAYLVDAFYQSTPFIPPLWSGTTGTKTDWRLLAFSLNGDADKSEYFAASTSTFSIRYRSCGGSDVSAQAVIFPNGLCDYGPYATDIFPRAASELHLLLASALSASSLNLSTSSFITVSYYDHDPNVFGERKFKLVAVDRIRYPLKELSLEEVQSLHTAPIFPSAFIAQFKPDSSALAVSWDPASDSDGILSSTSYEINISPAGGLDNALWQALSPEPRADFTDPGRMSYRYSRFVNVGDGFVVGLRAKDAFGKSSLIATSSWTYPVTDIVADQSQWDGGWSKSFGALDINQNYSVPDSASMQKISSSTDLVFDKFTVKVRQDWYGGYAPTNLRLSIYPDVSGHPDFNNLLGESVIKNISPLTDPQDITFSFSSMVTVPANNGGWAMLDVASYGELQGYFNNSWQNAVINGNPYAGGDSASGFGRGLNASCGNCSFGGYSDSGVDWYMKIGLTKSQ
ncbi:MAG: lamin tail domain-containing protein, partial [Patescibacteria group bacterium]|nr:lamin tail domain-containing protein [Patescibacteria group bacterium]